jgi:hypothetical protein
VIGFTEFSGRPIPPLKLRCEFRGTEADMVRHVNPAFPPTQTSRSVSRRALPGAGV